MITSYQTAKELKEKGFPQNQNSGLFYQVTVDGENEIVEIKTTSEIIIGVDKLLIAMPNLNELIKELGREKLVLFRELRKNTPDVFFAGIYRVEILDPEDIKNNEHYVANDEWNLKIPWKYREKGFTPEEAVARLWLKINK